MPGVAYFSVGVSDVEETAEAGYALVGELLGGFGKQQPHPMEGIAFAAAVAEGFVPDTASYLVEAAVGEPDDVERVGDLSGVGQRPVVGGPVRTRHVQHRPG